MGPHKSGTAWILKYSDICSELCKKRLNQSRCRLALDSAGFNKARVIMRVYFGAT